MVNIQRLGQNQDVMSIIKKYSFHYIKKCNLFSPQVAIVAKHCSKTCCQITLPYASTFKYELTSRVQLCIFFLINEPISLAFALVAFPMCNGNSYSNYSVHRREVAPLYLRINRFALVLLIHSPSYLQFNAWRRSARSG